jgi:flagellar motor protein MotB
LSLRQAEAVVGVLQTPGIDDDRISAHGMGESDPVASNATAVGRQWDRRVEFIIESDEGSSALVASCAGSSVPRDAAISERR